MNLPILYRGDSLWISAPFFDRLRAMSGGGAPDGATRPKSGPGAGPQGLPGALGHRALGTGRNGWRRPVCPSQRQRRCPPSGGTSSIVGAGNIEQEFLFCLVDSVKRIGGCCGSPGWIRFYHATFQASTKKIVLVEFVIYGGL